MQDVAPSTLSRPGIPEEREPKDSHEGSSAFGQ